MADKAARRQRCGEARGLPKANTSRAVSSFGQACGCSAGARGAGAGLFGGGEERGGELFVEREEVFYALAVVVEGLRAVTQVHGAADEAISVRDRNWLHVLFRHCVLG